MEDDIEIQGERFEQTPLTRERVDREKGEMYGVRVMGLKSAHGYEYTLEAQRAAAPRFESMAVGIDHDYSGGPLTSEAAWGTLFNVRVDDRGTLADLRFLKSHTRTEQILEDVDRDLGIFSFSPVTQRCVERPAGKVVSFVPVRCDLVVRGATTRKIFEQAPATPGVKVEEVEALKAEVATLKAGLAKFEQFASKQQAAEQAAAEADKAFDLKKFWNDK